MVEPAIRRFLTSSLAAALTERKRRVAFFMVDALRFELGVALEQKLKNDACTLEVVCAQLPTVTADRYGFIASRS